jgi:hypothetical protein
MNYVDLARAINRSKTYVSDRMRGAAVWDQGDQYKILDFFKIDDSRLHEFFPRGGIEA